MRWNSLTLVGLSALILVGCGSLYEGEVPEHYSNYQDTFNERNNGSQMGSRAIKNAQAELKREGFGLRLVRFGDRRPPANRMIDQTSDKVIYEYNLDEMLGNVTVRMSHQLGVDWPKPALHHEVVFPVEIDLTHMRALIKTGNLTSGRFGRYAVELEADFIIRDDESRVIARDDIIFEINYKRKSIDGRRPTAGEDREAILAAIRHAVQQLGVEVARDAKREYRKSKSNFIW